MMVVIIVMLSMRDVEVMLHFSFNIVYAKRMLNSRHNIITGRFEGEVACFDNDYIIICSMRMEPRTEEVRELGLSITIFQLTRLTLFKCDDRHFARKA